MAGYTISIQNNSPVYKLYQKLKADGVKDADLDTGYPQTDYIKKTRKTVHQGDHQIDETEVLNYALEHYVRYQLEIKQTTGHDVPWSLDDLKPETRDDAIMRAKTYRAITTFGKILSAKKLRPGIGRYDELMALSLYSFAMIGRLTNDGKKQAVLVPSNIEVELKKEGLFDVVRYVVTNGGGLDLAYVEKDCTLEATALEALSGNCGLCTEKSEIVLALFKLAGLKARSLYVEPGEKALAVLKAPKGILHMSVSLEMPGGKRRIFDAGGDSSNAEPFYKKFEVTWWYEQTGVELLASYYSNLGGEYDKQKNYSAAITSLQMSIDLSPASDAHTNLGGVYLGRGMVDQAIAESKIAVSIKPNNSLWRVNLAYRYMKKGDLGAALSELLVAVRLSPNLADAHLALGSIYAQQNKLDAAIGELKKAIRLEPAVAEAHTLLGAVMLTKGALKAAFSELELAVKLDPKSAKYLTNLAFANQKKGDFDRAETECKKAIDFDPNYTDAYLCLGQGYHSKAGQAEAAGDRAGTLRIIRDELAIYEKAKQHGVDVPDDFLDKLREAASRLEQFISNPETLPATKLSSAQLDAWRQRFSRGGEGEDKSSMVFDLCKSGDEYYRRNELDRALDSFKQAVKIDPKSKEALLGTWNVYKAMENKAMAKQACEQYKRVSHDKSVSCKVEEY